MSADGNLVGVAAYDQALAHGATRYDAREAAARAAAEHDGVRWEDASINVRVAYRMRFSTRPAYLVSGGPDA
jgi:hypothetical protein